MLTEAVMLMKWPEKETKDRRSAIFKATWFKTKELLEAELEKVHARNVELRTMHTNEQRRSDGWPRADRQPPHPGVIVTFEKYAGFNPETNQSEYVALRFPCDTFLMWEDNVRAIALALEALRKVDRYGITTGSQYSGYKALPAGDLGVNGLTPELAAQFIADSADMGNVPSVAKSILETPGFADSVYRAAAKNLHPDKGGDADQFAKLERSMSMVREIHKEVITQ
jgi:hypothetical protein